MSNKSLAKDSTQLTILVTGGTGFIGSHTCVELLNEGYSIVIVDNLSNSTEKVLPRIQEICGIDDERLSFYQCDVLDKDALNKVFEQHNIDAIIHFAGLKAVGESVEKPLEYYHNNIDGSLVLCDVARTQGVKNLVFSSSATVYGDPDTIPVTEDTPKKNATNPYGQTKSMLEQIFTDLYESDHEWNIVMLRYFNPIGAHKSGLLGEDPKGIPNNLVPYVAKVATGELAAIQVFGDDYPTIDGTGVRDYIHVVDLARGHVRALKWMSGACGDDSIEDRASVHGEPDEEGNRRGTNVFNLGTGTGSSVFEVIHAFEKACSKELPYVIRPRRAGDIAENYANCEKAAKELNWKAEYDLKVMCEDSWRWQSNNPHGYE